MKNRNTYRVWCSLLAAVWLLAACHPGNRKMPPMNPRFMYRDKDPMGTYIAYNLLSHQFTAPISLSSKKTSNLIDEFAYIKGTAFISIGKNLDIDESGLQQLLGYVERGNEFFISGNAIDNRLLDTLGIKRSYSFYQDGTSHKKFTSLQIADTIAYGNKQYGFYYYPFADVFTSFDSANTVVLGYNQNREADYLVVRYGKGKFYFHLEPAAFSNYFLLTKDNTQYYSQVFSYLNKDAGQVFWADNNRFGKKADDFSALAIFWKNPPLKYAMLLACSLMLLYIAFGSKRKRRLVPLLPANTNASLSFVKTIGNLYLQKKDNRNIAVKKMTYFLEYVRNKYHLNTGSVNMEFVQSLSRKSGIEETRVQSLMEKADYANSAETITDQELFDITNLIDEFYKR